MAYEYAISFEIKKDAGYGDRYSSLVDAITKLGGGYEWDETTSFALLNSAGTIEQLADHLYFDTKVDASKDILLVFDHERSVAICRGPVKYGATLKSHFRNCVLK